MENLNTKSDLFTKKGGTNPANLNRNQLLKRTLHKTLVVL